MNKIIPLALVGGLLLVAGSGGTKSLEAFNKAAEERNKLKLAEPNGILPKTGFAINDALVEVKRTLGNFKKTLDDNSKIIDGAAFAAGYLLSPVGLKTEGGAAAAGSAALAIELFDDIAEFLGLEPDEE